MRIAPVYILLSLFSFTKIYSQNINSSSVSGKNIFVATEAENIKNAESQKNATAGCPASMSLIGQDTSGLSITSGTTINCLSKPFYVYANAPSSITDSINQIWYPCILVRLVYASGMNNASTLNMYEAGVKTSCLGPTSACGFPIGYPSYFSGSWYFYHSYLDPTKKHDFVFVNTSVTATSTVTLKSCWTNQTYTTGVWPGAVSPSYSISVPANTNIGTASMSIVPTVTNTLAFQDLKNAQCYIDPKYLPLGTYTVTYTFKDTLCTGISTKYIFTVGLPNVSWTPPSVCVGLCPTLTPSVSAVPGGTWTGPGVSGTTFCGSTAGSFNVTYAVGTGTCSNSQTHPITVYNYPAVSISSTGPFCAGNSAAITAAGASIYSWSPATGLNTTSGPVVIASPTTSTTYYVSGTSNGCSTNSSLNLVVYPKPVANFSVDPQPTTINNSTLSFTDLSNGATLTNWNWNFGDGNFDTNQSPMNTYATVGQFTAALIVTSNYGCKDTVYYTINIGADHVNIYNSFSPNGDGLNDFFEIQYIDQFPKNHVYIYSRWGQLLWDGSNYDNVNVVWDGKDNKKNVLSAGTYFYIVEVDGKKTEKHWVELTK